MMQLIDVKKKIAPFLAENLGIKAVLGGFIILETLILMMVNWLGPQYHSVSFFNNIPLSFLPGALLLWVASCYLKDKSPRVSLFIECIGLIYLITFISDAFCLGIQLTPFPRHDLFFSHMDHLVGFHLLPIVNYVYTHSGFYYFFKHVYNSMGAELLLGPLLLALLFERRHLDVLFISILISTLIGFNIYYFFPTTDPAGALHDQHFLTIMYMVVQRFDALHLHEVIKGSLGGLIGFPSFHVIWAISIAYACRHRKILFYPFALLSGLIIISTLALGWHFLMDVIGGILVVSISFFLAERLSRVSKNHVSLSLSELLSPIPTYIKNRFTSPSKYSL